MTATDRVFDALENPGAYDECPECHGYGSSLRQDEEKCTECDGTGVIPKEESDE